MYSYVSTAQSKQVAQEALAANDVETSAKKNDFMDNAVRRSK